MIRYAIILFFVLLFVGPAFGQAPEKLFVGNCSFSGFALVSDSTYTGNIIRFDDRMGDGYNLTQLQAGDEIFDGRGLVFEIDVVNSATNFTANVTVTAKVDRGFEPFGSGQVYRPTASGLIPPSSQEQAGLSPTQKARIDRHNVVTMQSLIGDRDTVYSITNVSDTSTLSPRIGYIFVNSTADTMGIYGDDGWVLFFGGSGSVDTTLIATRNYADSLFNAADSLRALGDRSTPILIQAFDRSTQLNNCATSRTISTGFYLLDNEAIDDGSLTFEVNSSPAPITYDIYNADSTAYYFEVTASRTAGTYFWEVSYTDIDGNSVADLNSFDVVAGRPDTVTVFDPPGQDSILVTRVCGVEVSRDTIAADDGDWTVDADTLNASVSNVNIGAANMPTSQTIFNLQDQLAIYKDGFNGGTNYFFGNLAGWAAGNPSAGGDYSLANNFHPWWNVANDIRVEFENNAGPMQFYIEGINEAWYGLQNGATHIWSFGYDANINGSTLNWNNGFGIDATPSMSLSTGGDLYIPNRFRVGDTKTFNAYPLEVHAAEAGQFGALARFRNTDATGRGIIIRNGNHSNNRDALKIQLDSDTTTALIVYPKGQVIINSPEVAPTPDTTAALDIRSTDKGILPPRLTTAQRDAIPSPDTALTIHNTDTRHYNVRNAGEYGALSYMPTTVAEPTVDALTAIDLLYYDRGIKSLDLSSTAVNINITLSNPIAGGEYKFWIEGCSNDTITFPDNFLSRDRDSLKSRLCTTNEIIEFFYDGTNYITEDTIWNPVTPAFVDIIPPSLDSAYTQLGQDSVIVLKYNEELDNTSTPATTDFTISGGVGVSSVTVAGDSVVVYASSAYTCDSTITISYTAGVNPIRDVAENDAANLTDQAVTNNIECTALILDTYPGSVLALGLRKLDEDYTGDCIEVRRASDDTTQDIAFLGQALDTTSLLSFCSGTSCYVRTLYDQSGNAYNATQTTNANQPRIVNAGTLDREAGYPAMVFDGTNDGFTVADVDALSATNGAGTDTPLSAFFVYDHDKVNTNETIFAKDSGSVFTREYNLSCFSDTERRFLIKDAGGNNQQSRDDKSSGTAHAQVSMIYTGAESYTGIQFWEDGASSTMGDEVNATYTGMSNTSVAFTIGGYASSNFFTGTMQELIIWMTDQTSNRTGIEDNQSGFYSTP